MRSMIIVLLGLAAAAPCTVRAQAPESRTGAWFGVGAGGGWTRISCAICSADRNIGAAGTVRVGTALRSGLLVGAEADLWTREDGDVRHLLGAFSGAAYLYPRPDGALYLKGGAGYVAYRAEDDLASNLFGVVVGAGYELRMGENLVLTNDVSLVASSFGALKEGDQTVADDVSVTMLRLGVGIRRR